MCNKCNENSNECCVWHDEEKDEYYFEHESIVWDYYNDEFSKEYITINYCPWCGRKLSA